MAEQLRVMISSTARDLPEHRKEVMDACLRQGMFPVMMEHLPASDAEAVPASLKMVDDADIYLLILAHRYGYVPEANNPTGISVTEHEYNRAAERKMPILTFAMHEDHPVKAADVETGEGAIKLKAFKNRAQLKGTNFFISPADLRADVINSLSQLRQPDLTAFHYVSDIPTPPDVFIAHPYTLLQTHTLVGRQKELKLLTDWITGDALEFDGQKAPADSVRIMSVIAIGGMGKSALTWKWFNDVAPQEMKNLAGRMWWSFYESDATFENFVIRALAYVSKRSIQELTGIPAPEREAQLLAALDHEPVLLALDGLERILIAYARMDAARLDDSEVGKEKNLRKTADPRVGSFLKRLAQVKKSRVLVSSRLYPAELETAGGDSIPGIFKTRLEGLTDDDAVELCRTFGVRASRDELLPVFDTFAKHPLLIQALAGEVKRYRKAPGGFEEWRKANHNFDPNKFSSLQDAMAHVLEFALRGLDKNAEKVLNTIAPFRMPTGYDTLAAILVGEGKACVDEPELDTVLSELEDRGLVGWDKRANRYDLHPIVRGVVWTGLGDETRLGVYTSLQAHFAAVPKIDNWLEVDSLEDLTPAIELYNTLIGLGRYEEAYDLFYYRLDDATLYRLSANRQRVELLQMLFPDGMGKLPALSAQPHQASALNALAMTYQHSGRPALAAVLYRSTEVMYANLKDNDSLTIGLCNLSSTLLLCGSIREAENSARRALRMSFDMSNRRQEGEILFYLGLILGAKGDYLFSGTALYRSMNIWKALSHAAAESLVIAHLAQQAQRECKHGFAVSLANKAWALARIQRLERDFIYAARAQGEASLGLNDFAAAEERLHHAISRARRVNLVDEELTAAIAISELRRRQSALNVARGFLDDVWEPAERGPYPLFHADALNVLAQIERDEGANEAAIAAATKAYRLAWCDGPPFAYHWGLEKAKQHLKELGAPEPEMPPFDESKFEPMPEVEINPHDEFYVDEESNN
jgi:tetratricopeptide (TPR) repeat protein